MASYTIKINERTNAGKSLLKYLASLGVLVEKKTESQYDQELLEVVKKGDDDYKNGKCKKVKVEDLWK